MATETDQIPPLATRTVNDDINIIISWDETLDIRGAEVTGYRILIHTINAVGIEEELHCKGTDTAIVDSRSCTVPVSIL